MGYAADIGINAVRIRASPSAYKEDRQGFCLHFDEFLNITSRHNISVLPILFDTGDILSSVSNISFLESYLQDTIVSHSTHPYVLGFDVCNECYFSSDQKKQKQDLKALIESCNKLIGPKQFTTTGMGDYGYCVRIQKAKIVVNCESETFSKLL